MKTKLLMSMATLAMIMAGCSSDENGMDNGTVEIRITSGVEVQQSRAFTPTQGTSIKAGEVVSVWVDDAGTTPDPTPLYEANQLTANASNGFTGNSMYFPQTGNAINIYAIHGTFTTPFATGNTFPTTAVEYSVAANQSTAGAANYTNSDLLYAYDKNVTRNGNPTTKELTFYHMLSKLELAIVRGNGAPELAATNAVTLGGVTLNGNFTPSTTADMTNQTERAAMLSAADTPAAGDMTLGQQTCADFTDANIFYNEAILVPQDMIGKVLTFKLASGGTLTYTIPAGEPAFESGRKYRYHIRLTLTGLSVTSKIEDWGVVGAVDGSAEM